MEIVWQICGEFPTHHLVESEVSHPSHPGVQEPQHEGAGEVEAGKDEVDCEVDGGGRLPHGD